MARQRGTVKDAKVYGILTGGIFIGLLIVGGVFVWLVTHGVIPSGPAPTFVVYLLAALLPAVVLFGFFQLTGDDAIAEGTILGVKFRLVGPAALFFVVLSASIFFESNAPQFTFVIIFSAEEQDISENGTITLRTPDKDRTVKIENGSAHPTIPSRFEQREVTYIVNIPGYEKDESGGRIRLVSGSEVRIPLVRSLVYKIDVKSEPDGAEIYVDGNLTLAH